MRIAILANTLPAALPIYSELNSNSEVELLVALCSPPGHSPLKSVIGHLARWLVKAGRWQSLRLALSGRLVLCPRPLDHPKTLARLNDLKLDVGLHKTGNIYRQPTIDCFGVGILNAHIGVLPRYRGRSVMEWSLLENQPTGITVFFIDAGIDSGARIVLSEEINISHCKSLVEAKQYLFNLDARFYRRAVDLLMTGNPDFGLNDSGGQRYYVMSELFEKVTEQCLLLQGRELSGSPNLTRESEN